MRIALDSHVGRKPPHREIRFQGIDVDLDPFDRAGPLGILRNERHVRIQQEAEIGALDQGQGIEAGEAGRALRNAEIERIEFRNPDAAGLRKALQHRDRFWSAPEIGGERDRVFRRHQLRGDFFDPRRLDSA
jgi:hypothetical protein